VEKLRAHVNWCAASVCLRGEFFKIAGVDMLRMRERQRTTHASADGGDASPMFVERPGFAGPVVTLVPVVTPLLNGCDRSLFASPLDSELVTTRGPTGDTLPQRVVTPKSHKFRRLLDLSPVSPLSPRF
jgi:hypothetical protein